MYELPLIFANGKKASKAGVKGIDSRPGIPLHEHTAFLLACGALHDDLDDRVDAFRGALEIDPLLATWAVYVARKQKVKLTSLNIAARWLATSFQSLLPNPRIIAAAKPLSVPRRAAWRELATQAVECARLAKQASTKRSPESGSRDFVDVFWLAMLCSMKARLDAVAQMNGHSPLGGFTLSWPKWLRNFEKQIDRPETVATNAIAEAISATAAQRVGIVSDEEKSLWFRPYPEFRSLIPSLFAKLRRLNEMEENFAELLQKEKLASLQQLAYGASHEINNPLANISTRAQTLVYSEHDPERRKKLLAINQQAFRAYEMIADLMLFAKPPRMEVEEVDVIAMLDQIQDELTDDAVRKEIRLQFRKGSEDPECKSLTCHADPVQLITAIKAICLNGIEAMVEGGVLSVDATSDDSSGIVITIEDNGSGLSESAQRHLFDPFFSGREAGRGLGFGLSKAWRIVEQHHGRIEVSSYPNKGSRFTVCLPAEFGGAGELSKSHNAAGVTIQPAVPPSSSHDHSTDTSVSG